MPDIVNIFRGGGVAWDGSVFFVIPLTCCDRVQFDLCDRGCRDEADQCFFPTAPTKALQTVMLGAIAVANHISPYSKNVMVLLEIMVTQCTDRCLHALVTDYAAHTYAHRCFSQ
jgi:hypothetical protein